MLCEIVNPSDPYTLETDNFVAAAVGIMLVGNGQLGLSCDDTGECTPVLFGWEEWCAEHGVDQAWVDSHRGEIADALDSVMIGSVAERAAQAEAMRFIDDPEKREAYRSTIQDRQRSSLNDIGNACWNMAKLLRKMTLAEDAEVHAAPIVAIG